MRISKYRKSPIGVAEIPYSNFDSVYESLYEDYSVTNDFSEDNKTSSDSMFVGRWIEISSENVLDYHKASGVPIVMAMIASKMKLDVEIFLVENGFRQITRTLLKNVDATFDFTKPVVLFNPLTRKNDRIRAERGENLWTLICGHPGTYTFY